MPDADVMAGPEGAFSPARRAAGGAGGLGARARRQRAGGCGRAGVGTHGNWDGGLKQTFWLGGALRIESEQKYT